MNFEDNVQIIDGITKATNGKLTKEEIYSLGRMVIDSFYAGRDSGYEIGTRTSKRLVQTKETETV